jgi:hypothetical protein
MHKKTAIKTGLNFFILLGKANTDFYNGNSFEIEFEVMSK